MHDEKIHGKWIPGYEGRYSVTTEGEVWSFRRCRCSSARRLNPTPAKRRGSYPLVHLYGDGKKRVCRAVHILVMLTYVGPRPEGMEICHNNGDPLDCRLSNLRYDTSTENNFDIKKHGRQLGPRRRFDDATAKKIKTLLKRGGPLGFQSELSRRYGLHSSTLSGIKRGKIWKDV